MHHLFLIVFHFRLFEGGPPTNGYQDLAPKAAKENGRRPLGLFVYILYLEQSIVFRGVIVEIVPSVFAQIPTALRGRQMARRYSVGHGRFEKQLEVEAQ